MDGDIVGDGVDVDIAGDDITLVVEAALGDGVDGDIAVSLGDGATLVVEVALGDGVLDSS